MYFFFFLLVFFVIIFASALHFSGSFLLLWFHTPTQPLPCDADSGCLLGMASHHSQNVNRLLPAAPLAATTVCPMCPSVTNNTQDVFASTVSHSLSLVEDNSVSVKSRVLHN